MRRICHREAAARVAWEQDIDVLAGKELQSVVRRQLELQSHDIGCEALHLVHAHRQFPYLDSAYAPDFPRRDHEITERARLTEEGQTCLPLRIRQRVFLVMAVIDAALEQLALAGAARSVAAPVGDDDAAAQRGVEHCFTLVDGEDVVAGFDGDPVWHAEWIHRGRAERQARLSAKIPL